MPPGEALPLAPSRRAVPPALRGVRAAFALLTRLPVGGFPYADADLRWSAAHLPLVGAAIGALLAIVWTATLRAGSLVAAAVTVAASLLVTGALHEDGLADTADALGGGGADRARVLTILKDSRIGAFGAAALSIALVLRVALLARLAPAAPAALVLAEALSRLVPVGLMAALPYVTDRSVAKSRALTRPGAAQVAVAAAWTVAAVAAIAWAHAFSGVEMAAACAAAVLAALACGATFRARAGGVTGDFLGAAQQVAECAALLALALWRGIP